jgi:hypothetical protein
LLRTVTSLTPMYQTQRILGEMFLSVLMHANLDTLTSVYAGSIAYDTTEKSIKVHDGAQWQSLSFGLTKDTSITIASAEVLTLNSSPVTIVPAPGAGYALRLLVRVLRVL